MSFHKKALYTDMTQNYLTPVEPMSHTRVKVRFRTGRGNVDRVTICYNGQKAVIIIGWVSVRVKKPGMILFWYPDLPPRIGQKAQLYIRSMLTAFTMVIPLMM